MRSTRWLGENSGKIGILLVSLGLFRGTFLALFAVVDIDIAKQGSSFE